MSIATFGELKTAIAAWSEHSDLTSQLPDFVNYAQQEIGRRLRSLLMLTTAAVTANAELVAVPTRFAALKSMYLDVSPRVAVRVVSSETAQDMSTNYATLVYPLVVADEGANLRFAPLYTGTPVAQTLYYQKPAAMTADGDTNTLLTTYPFLYLYGALSELYRFLEDAGNADRYEGRFQALIDSIHHTEGTDAMRGPLQSQPSPGGIV